MKFQIPKLALVQTARQHFRPAALHIEPNHAGHSRTLYTSIVPEQSNIIF
jgi:hypothetical protein